MAREYEADYSGSRPRLIRKQIAKYRRKRRIRRFLLVLLTLGVIGVGAWFGWQYLAEHRPDVAQKVQPWIDSSAEFLATARRRAADTWKSIAASGADEVPLPESGVVLSDPRARDALTGLEVRVPEGATHYFVKVRRLSDKATVATLFVRAGKKGYVALLPGKYQLAWTSGTSWYGFERLFGAWGVYQVGETLEITAAQGWSIDMQKTMLSDYNTFPSTKSAFRK